MTEPINYIGAFAGAPNPFEEAVKGYQAGFGIQQAERAKAQAAQQDIAARQQAVQLAAAQQEARNNPSADAYARLITLNPQAHEAFKSAWAMQNESQQQANLSRTASFVNAFKSGSPDVAISAMRSYANALGEDSTEGKKMAALATLAEKHPDLIAGQFQAMLAANPKGEGYIKALGEAGKEERAQQLQPGLLATGQAEAKIKGATAALAPEIERTKLRDTESQIRDRAGKLGLDQDRLVTETQLKLTEMQQKFGQLPDDARKIVNDSASTAVVAEQQVQQYQNLASQVAGLGESWGVGTSAKEWLKRTTGNEDAESSLKREYTRMATTGVTKLLPPGPASDKDIQMAKEGIPPSNASPQVLASYLRGMAKLSAYDAVLSNAKAEWAGSVHHLGRAGKDVTIEGTKVPAGTTFNEFARTYLADKAQALDAAATVSSRSYMRAKRNPDEYVESIGRSAIPPVAGAP